MVYAKNIPENIFKSIFCPENEKLPKKWKFAVASSTPTDRLVDWDIGKKFCSGAGVEEWPRVNFYVNWDPVAIIVLLGEAWS